MRDFILKTVLVVLALCNGAFLWSNNTNKNGYTAAYQLFQRVLPKQVEKFQFDSIPSANGTDVFEIEQGANNQIIIRGNRTISIVSGVNYYLKHVAKCHFSWSGDQLQLPTVLPKVTAKIRKESPYKHTFNFNYCTFNYTMSWWNWQRWEREIDFMALNGVDMPLAIVGMEAVWLNFLKRFGYSAEQAKKYIAGPAYTAWWLMGNLEGRGGPVTDSWIAERTALQQRILSRMRALGMTPVLPAFVGLVPSNLTNVIPNAPLLDQGKWLMDTRPAILHPDDSLFTSMGKAWYEELEKLYGKTDVFSGDLFHEGGKSYHLNVANIALKVQQIMLAYNPKAIWTIQGWGGNPSESLLSKLDPKHTLVIELCNEFFRNWERTKGFYGKPWVFSTIIQYGGNVALHGRLNAIAQNLADALASAHPPVGLGTTWESIEVNPVVNDFMADIRWEKKLPPVTDWVQNYAVRRYGYDTPSLRKAWTLIAQTAYGSYEGHRRPTESVFCARPSLNVQKASPFAASIDVKYDQGLFHEAILLLLKDAKKAENKACYSYDVVDFTRQFLANTAQIPYRNMVSAYKAKDVKGFEKWSTVFLQMLDDQNELLGTVPHFLLGKWINDARIIATTDEQRQQNEHNARLLITTWTKENSDLADYGWREWNGLLETFYKPRWTMFISALRSELKGEMPAPRTDYYLFESSWAAQSWQQQSYSITPQGNPIALAKKLVQKWSFLILNPNYYHFPPAKKADFIENPQHAR